MLIAVHIFIMLVGLGKWVKPQANVIQFKQYFTLFHINADDNVLALLLSLTAICLFHMQL